MKLLGIAIDDKLNWKNTLPTRFKEQHIGYTVDVEEINVPGNTHTGGCLQHFHPPQINILISCLVFFYHPHTTLSLGDGTVQYKHEPVGSSFRTSYTTYEEAFTFLDFPTLYDRYHNILRQFDVGLIHHRRHHHLLPPEP